MDTDEWDHIPDAVMEDWIDRYGDRAVSLAAASDPHMFAKLWRDGDDCGIERGGVAAHAGCAWRRWGDVALSRDEWREAFALAGYCEDDEPATRPGAPLTLWRGAQPLWRTHWSWTEDRDAALLYASGYLLQAHVGAVWRAVVEPSRLLAKFGSGKTSEYIVNTDGLRIEPDGLWCRCPVDLGSLRGSDLDAQAALDLHELVTCTR